MNEPRDGSGPALPAAGEWILQRVLPAEEAESLAGDCLDLYREKRRGKGSVRARFWFWGQVARAVGNAAGISLYWNLFMFRVNLRVALRFLRRDRVHSAINIVGLGIGMAGCLLILLWVRDELGFDRFHEHGDRIHRVLYRSGTERYSTTCAPLAAALEADLPEVRMASRYRPLGPRLIKYGDAAFRAGRFCVTDPRFFEMFTFPFIQGNADNALSGPDSLVLTEKTANRIFGDEDPLGKILRVENRFDFKVSGILKDIPGRSHIQFDALARFEFLSRLWGEDLTGWGSNSHITYVMLREGVEPESVESRIDGVYKKNLPRAKGDLILYPMTGIHLSPFGMWVDEPSGSRVHVLLFSMIAGFTLLIAGINFVNLTTARSLKRMREVGVRKTVGARRGDLIRQFYAESLLSAGLAFLLALALIPAGLPSLNRLSEKNLSMTGLGDAVVLGGLILIAVMTGFLSGTYPALFISSFKPGTALRSGSRSGGSGRSALRKGLVVLQFGISVFLIIGTFIISGQLRYIHRQDLGFEKENIITMPVSGALLRRIGPAAAEIMQHPDILNLSLSSTLPGKRESTTSQIGWEGKDPDAFVRFQVLYVDLQFLDTFGMEMADGRYFSRSHVSELRNGVIINQTAARAMGFTGESPVGKRLLNAPSASSRGRDATIIGVVRDFHARSLHHGMEPLVMTFATYPQDNLSFRLRAGAVPGVLAFLEDVWSRVAPDYAFEYRFLDEVIGGLYRSEERMGRLFRIFSGLAIFISCLGLFGLASYSAERKTKEIGIRKVFGATEAHIILRQSREFLGLVLAAVLAAAPLAFLAGRRWLQGYAFRMTLEFWIFPAAGALALAIAFVTVSLQTARAARADPVESLRYE